MATSVEKVDWTVQNIMWKEKLYPSSLDIDSANLLHGSRDQARPATAALQVEVFAALHAGVYNQNHNLRMKSCSVFWEQGEAEEIHVSVPLVCWNKYNLLPIPKHISLS